MAIEPQQASPMSKMDGTKLPNTPCLGHFGPVYLLQLSRNDDEERCF
jgi:hypothetical protein